MRHWLIKQLGGFPDFDAALKSIKDMNDAEKKHQVLTEAVKHLFNAIGPDDVLRRDAESGVLIFRGKPMLEVQEAQLVEEARQLLGMKLWQILRMDARWQFNKKMFYESRVNEDLVWGKLLIFYDDIIRNVLNKLKNGV